MRATDLPVLIPMTLFISALLIALLQNKSVRVLYCVAQAGVVAAFSCAIAAAIWKPGVLRHRLGGWPAPIGIELVWDALSAFFCLVILGVGMLVFIHNRESVERELRGRVAAFYACASLLLGAFLGMVLTGDLFNLYVFLEISSLAGYALVAAGDRRSPVAAFRYLILGTIGASFYLIGIGFIFIMTGSLNMADVRAILPIIGPSPAVVGGVVFIVVGLGLKMALFPLHGWLPDTYTSAPSATTTLMGPLGTKVAAYGLLRVVMWVFGIDFLTQFPVMTAVTLAGAAGIVWGSVLAIAQHDLKRMLAYSSVAQVGYIAVGIGLGTRLALIGALLHVLNHAVMKACLFMVNTIFLKTEGHTDLRRFDSALRHKLPWTTAAFTLAALSMIGLPPLAGFFSKWYLVLATVEAAAWIPFIALLVSTLLNAVYFFRVIERMYLRTPEEETPEPQAGKTDIPVSMALPPLLLALSLLLLGLGNMWVVNRWLEPAVRILQGQ